MLDLEPTLRHVLLARHLQQLDLPNQNPADWAAAAALDLRAATPVAELVRKQYLDGLDIAIAGHSALRRTRDSIALQVISRAEILEMEGLTPTGYNRIDGDWAFCAKLPSATAEACYRAESKLLRLHGTQVFRAVKHAAEHLLRDGQAAFLVSHSPLVESAVAHATNTWPPVRTFQKGDIAHFRFERHRFIVVEYLPIPPAAISAT
ncbi:hypothetical protein HY970_04190 [Candidatus Kaiserbacteria bacterium]|nr:hypothetical protein [Candidatus Kaiserbacteria bacterium]